MFASIVSTCSMILTTILTFTVIEVWYCKQISEHSVRLHQLESSASSVLQPFPVILRAMKCAQLSELFFERKLLKRHGSSSHASVSPFVSSSRKLIGVWLGFYIADHRARKKVITFLNIISGKTFSSYSRRFAPSRFLSL